MPESIPTLSSHDYCSEEVFAAERHRLFHSGWFLVDRAGEIGRGGRRTYDVAGESVLVTRDLDGHLHAFANVCRHRGARLCEPSDELAVGPGSLMCPYHAWVYALDGRLIATPHLADDEIDRSALSLWAIDLHEWAGCVFVCLAAAPAPFDEWLAVHGDGASELADTYGLADLCVGATTRTTVAANWKIVVENYQECLHCPRVHPELVDVIPAYRTGSVWDPARDDGAARLVGGGNSFSQSGFSNLPVLPGVSAADATLYRGVTLYPTAFLDATGTSVIATIMFPRGPAETDIVTHYLFAPVTVAAAGFDPSSIVEFSELVARQDYQVCERVQRGVSSARFVHGALTPKDDLVVHYTRHYLRSMGR